MKTGIRLIPIVAVGIAVLLPDAAVAQNNFGEFIDMGATKVYKDEFISITPAAINAPGQRGQSYLIFHSDGTLTGEFTLRPEGSKSPITGTWSMDENGRRCINERFTAWGTTYQDCTYMYRLNGKYYGTVTDSDRSAPVRVPLIAYQVNIKK